MELAVPNKRSRNDAFNKCRGSYALEHIPRVPVMSKIVCDPIHGQMSISPICVAIIDTPEFQRLRNIKQTGFLNYVYPGATHTRFSHSLGVCYLAGLFARQLSEHQPELAVTPSEILCIEIAGLCHDLGHGPLSHAWEDFMSEIFYLQQRKLSWKHEIVSQNILDYLLKKNNLLPELEKYGIGPKEISNIKQMIVGAKPENKEKTFLFQIVNNDNSGLDVDKWDYFLRDCHCMGLPCSFEYQRLVKFAKVLPVNGRQEICFRDKVLESVYNVFRTRSNLHRLAYQHRIVNILEKMYTDALLKADGILTSPSGEMLCLSEWSINAAFGKGETQATAIEKYCKLTDDLILCSMKHTTNHDLQDVVTLISAIEKRSCKCCGFYQQIAIKICPIYIDNHTVLKEMVKYLPEANDEVSELESENGAQPVVTMDDLAIKVTSVHWGKRSKDPVQFVHFYSKSQPFRVSAVNSNESSVNLPRAFEEIQLHVMCRRSDPYAIKVSKLCFSKYWHQFSQNGDCS